MGTRFRSIAIAALCCSVLTSCLKATVDARITDDGMVRGEFVLAFAYQILPYVGQSRDSILREVRLASESTPDGVRVETVDDGAYVGERITFDRIAAEQFGPTMAAIAKSAGPFGALVAQDVTLTRTAKTWQFFGSMDLSRKRFDISASNGADPQLPDRTFFMTIKLTFPGLVTARDKDGRVRGRSIMWEPKLGEVVQMQAIARRR